MALSPQPDIRFLRNTGFALVTATLLAGAIMLSLVRTESKPVILADSSDRPVKELVEPVHLTAEDSTTALFNPIQNNFAFTNH
jgi:hypothetical protein